MIITQQIKTDKGKRYGSEIKANMLLLDMLSVFAESKINVNVNTK